MANENGSKRRDWVKNAAIIFLSVLLVLTFFSNTVMNYSLPEVAAQYIMSGTITAKIRGTGTIESEEPYVVEIGETRKVEKVLVREGDMVQKGDVMFVLADKDSEELEAAEEALAQARLAFEKTLLSGSVSKEVADNVQKGHISSFATYQSRIIAAEAEIEKWEKGIDEIELKISQLQGLQGQLEVSKADYTAEETKYQSLLAKYNGSEYQKAKAEAANLQAKIDECQSVIDTAAKKVIVGYEKDLSGNDDLGKPIYEISDTELSMAKANLATYQGLLAQQNVILNDTQKKDADAKLAKEVEDARVALENKKNSVQNSSDSVKVQLNNWQLELTDKQKKLADAQASRDQLLGDIATELDLDSSMDNIAKLQEEVNELREQAVGAIIEAPISGTVSSVDVIAGQNASAGSSMASLQPEGSGFTMSFSVTTEQARKVNPGVQAELINAWRYDDVTAVLSKIKPDPSDPSGKKLLTFDVTGSVMAGQSLSVAVGDRSSQYDMIVPNSAVREDNNGKFILIVESKPSPLGNRYKAVRVDVEILASDDTQSAISGANLFGYEFVITTSNKPVEAGQLIRMTES